MSIPENYEDPMERATECQARAEKAEAKVKEIEGIVKELGKYLPADEHEVARCWMAQDLAVDYYKARNELEK